MNLQSRIGLVFAAAALVAAGFFAGASQPTATAQDAVETSNTGFAGTLGVPIPNGGAALVKGKDGYAYVVDPRGVYVRASQSGKGLMLP